METVELISIKLKALKKSLPVYYSAAGSLKLKLKFFEYKYLIGALPDKFVEIKNQSNPAFQLVGAKIDNCSNPAYSIARKAYQEAVRMLNAEIDSVLVKLWLERTKRPS